ncbi:MAG TPA: hypothetical protein PKA88_11305, partial [Polyangiaceae bacterium]|nr:hypothetical protein [Polyangiaceae bacterium]
TAGSAPAPDAFRGRIESGRNVGGRREGLGGRDRLAVVCKKSAAGRVGASSPKPPLRVDMGGRTVFATCDTFCGGAGRTLLSSD